MSESINESVDTAVSKLQRLFKGSGQQSVLITLASSLAAVAIALVLAGILLWATGKSPFDAYSKMLEAGLTNDKLLETVQRASGRIRAFVLYENTNIATAEGSGPLVGGFYDAVESLLAEPPRRSELHIVHAFARG